MNKIGLLAIALGIALVISIGFNAYLGSQNIALSNQNNAQATKLEMSSILTQVQLQVSSELRRIGGSVVYACEQLSTLGLEGNETRAVLSALAANSTFIIDAATADLNNTLITVEPSAHRDVEGMNVGKQDYMNTESTNPILPAMTNVIPLVEGFYGAAIVAPIFNASGGMIGSVSVIFDPTVLMNASIAPAIKGTTYTFSVSQTNGYSIYNTDPAQQGKVLFTDPMYAGYTELLEMGRHMTVESSGYAIYKYNLDTASSQIVQKECYWKTIGAYGTEWRLIIIHTLGN